MTNKEIELKHATVFLDIAFGVLIGLPLLEILPRLANGVITEARGTRGLFIAALI
jgi:hypothetical protein